MKTSRLVSLKIARLSSQISWAAYLEISLNTKEHNSQDCAIFSFQNNCLTCKIRNVMHTLSS